MSAPSSSRQAALNPCRRKAGAAAKIPRRSIICYRRAPAGWIWVILDRLSRERYQRGAAQTKDAARLAATKAKHDLARNSSDYTER